MRITVAGRRYPVEETKDGRYKCEVSAGTITLPGFGVTRCTEVVYGFTVDELLDKARAVVHKYE